MTISERITSLDEHRRLRDDVIRLDERRERRAPQRWWEKAQANQLVSKEYTGPFGDGDAA